MSWFETKKPEPSESEALLSDVISAWKMTGGSTEASQIEERTRHAFIPPHYAHQLADRGIKIATSGNPQKIAISLWRESETVSPDIIRVSIKYRIGERAKIEVTKGPGEKVISSLVLPPGIDASQEAIRHTVEEALVNGADALA